MSKPRCKVRTSCPVRSDPAEPGCLKWALLMACGKTLLVDLPTGRKAPRIYDCCGNAPGESPEAVMERLGSRDSAQVEDLPEKPSEAPAPTPEPKAPQPVDPEPIEDQGWVSVMDMLDSLPED
jgi:hypothetical protein